MLPQSRPSGRTSGPAGPGPGDDRRTRELSQIFALVSRGFSDTRRYPAGVFRLFRDEQRALGEIMLEPVEGKLRHYQCIGYATFAARLEADPEFSRWFQRLSSEVGMLAHRVPGQLDRLIGVQQALVNIIDFLDPDGLGFPREHLTRLPLPPDATLIPEPQQPVPG